MTALRCTTSARWAHVGAMHRILDARDFNVAGEYLTIGDLAPIHGRPMVCCINGDFISRADWWQPVRPGDVIVFADLASGGGNNSDAGRLIATIAVAVASAYTGGAVGTAYGSAWGAAASVAVSVAGGALINRLFPVSQPTAQGGSGRENSPTYSTTLEGNSPRLGSAVPVRYGQEKFYPDWACPAYSEFQINSEMYYATGLSVGLGEYNILAIYIDDTPIQHFADAQVQIVGPGMSTRSQQTGYEGVESWGDVTVISTGMLTSVEVGGQDLIDTVRLGPYVVTGEGVEVDYLYFDVIWPRGVGTVEDDGSITDYTIQYRLGYQLVDDDGAPVGPWWLKELTYTDSTTKPVRRTLSYEVPAGRYRAYMQRVTAREDNDRILNDMQWAQLRGRMDGPGVVRDDLTGVAIRIRSSQQLSGLNQRRVKVYAQRLLPIFDGSDWSEPQATRSIAWALADVWRSTTYGRGLPDSRIDLESLLAYDDVWADRQDRFDYSFDTQRTTDDASQIVAAAGRARTMLRRGAVYSLVRDEPQDDAVAVFMPRNMDRDSFGLSWGLPTTETADCIAATFRSGRYWGDRIVYAQVYEGTIYTYTANAAGVPNRPSGLPEPSMIEDVRLDGVIGEMQALRQVAYLLARSLYRREEGSFTADIDGLLMSMGSMIGIAHDAAEWGQSGDVVAWDASDLLMTLAEPPTWSPGDTHYIRLQDDDGALGEAIEVTPGDTAYQVVLADAPSFTPTTDDPDRERTRYLFGALADVQRKAIAAGIRPTAEDAVEVEFFIEDDRVHDADNEYLPTSSSDEQDPLDPGIVDEIPSGDSSTSDDPFAPDVYLTEHTIRAETVFDLEENGDPIGASIQFGNDGVLTLTASLSVVSDPSGPIPGQWLADQPTSSGDADDYEIRFDQVATFNPSGLVVLTSPTLGVWHSLGTSRLLEWDAIMTDAQTPVDADVFVSVRCRIRNAATLLLHEDEVLKLAVRRLSP
jgi:hypothetical protein